MKSIEVCAAIILKNNEIFVTQRGYGEFKGKWEFPGGKIRKAESKQHALKREIKEELSADIKIIKYLKTINYSYTNFNLIMHCYICNFKNSYNLNEHTKAVFITLKKLKTVDLLPADKLLINDLANYLNQC